MNKVSQYFSNNCLDEKLKAASFVYFSTPEKHNNTPRNQLGEKYFLQVTAV